MEQWLPIPGWEGFYEASDLGRIRSVPRYMCKGCVLKPRALPEKGYLQVGLSRNNKVTMSYVHRLVAATFIGPCPEGLEVLHGDGDPANNVPGNLRYGTHGENGRDMVRHGRTQTGTKHYRSYLTDDEVVTIRSLLGRGVRQRDLVRMFNTTRPVISRIASNFAYQDGEWSRPLETCHFPGCDQSAEGSVNGARPRLYCISPDHNRLSAKRARKAMLSGNTHNIELSDSTWASLAQWPIHCSLVHSAIPASGRLARSAARPGSR